MPIFDLKKIIAVRGKQAFYQLTINDNPEYEANDATEEQRNRKKTGVLDEFAQGLEKKYEKDMRMIYTYMDRIANNLPVSGKHYHELKRPDSDPIKDYEFKHGDIRVYCFKDDSGKICAVAGYKNQQDEDIKRLRSLKKQYFDSQKK